jgi:hypothetical protein
MPTNKKITELDEITSADLADDDVLPIVDISAGKTFKVRKSTLASALSGVTSVAATSPVAVNQATGNVTVSIGTVPVASGGTGATTLAAHGTLIGNGTGAVAATATGSAGQVLTSTGASSAPTYQTISAGGPALDGGGTGEESVIRTNKNQISGNVALTVPAGSNGMSAGPITITSGSSVTVASGAAWHIVGA